MNQKKAFTLIELIGVIVILGILMLLVFPSIVNTIKKTQGELDEAGKKILYSSMDMYIKDRKDEFPLKEGNSYCITVKELLDTKALESTKLVQNLKETDIIEVIIKNGTYIYQLNNSCSEYVYGNADESGANAPELSNNMIPVKYDGANWIKANYRNPEGQYRWYDYDTGMWANAIIPNSYIKIKDLSGNGYHGTLRGANRKKVDGTLTTSFDGIDDYIEVPVLPATINWADGFTIEFTATWEEFKNWMRIFDFGNGPSKQNILVTNGEDDQIDMHIYFDGIGSTKHYSEQTAEVNKKINLKMEVQKNDTAYHMNFYLNNVLKKSIDYTHNGILIPNIQRIYNYIGKSNWNDPYFKGKMYELKITEASGKMILWYDFTNNSNYIEVNDYQNSPIGTVIPEEDIVAYFVWIPRYEYMYTNLGTSYAGGTATNPGEIKVKFLSDKSTNASTNYKVHPGFTFGTKELSGIWVGKFETSSGYDNTIDDVKTTQIYIKPNLLSLRKQTLANEYSTALNTKSLYRLDPTDSPHIIKNSEWGAVAYLSQSKYGKYGNANYTGANKEIYENKSTYITGKSNGTPSTDITGTQCDYNNLVDRGNGLGACGAGASTTGTIYGIYDMNGGSWEHTLANYNHYVGTDTTTHSGFKGTLGSGETLTTGTDFPADKYFDLYTTVDEKTSCNGGICYGQGLSETLSWYQDAFDFVEAGYPWICRGGSYVWGIESGIFATGYSSGRSSEYTIRIVITK